MNQKDSVHLRHTTRVIHSDLLIRFTSELNQNKRFDHDVWFEAGWKPLCEVVPWGSAVFSVFAVIIFYGLISFFLLSVSLMDIAVCNAFQRTREVIVFVIYRIWWITALWIESFDSIQNENGAGIESADLAHCALMLMIWLSRAQH